MSETRLARVVKLRTVVSTGAGMALATVSYSASMELATLVLGDSAWIAILVSGLLCLLAGACFAELSGMYPTAAGIKLFIQHAFDERVAMFFATLYITVAISVVGAETFVLARVLHDGTGITAIPPWAWGVAFLLLVLTLNVLGIKIAGTFQDILAYSMFAFLIASSIYAIAVAPAPLQTPVIPGNPASFAKAVAVGVFLFVGFEWVTPLAEEVIDQRLIARGLFWTIWVLFLTYALFNAGLTMTMAPAIQATPQDPAFAQLIDAAIAKGALPATVDRAALTYDQAKKAFGTTVVPHVLFYEHLFGRAGIAFIIVMSLTASITSFNAGTITASRYMYALARDGSLPKIFSRISIRYATPYMALIALSALCLTISAIVFVSEHFAPESYELFIYLGAFIESMIYTVMACAVMSLRRREPERARPYRVPGGDLIPAIVALFFGFLMVTIVFDRPLVAVVVTVVAGLCAYYGWFIVPAMRARARAARSARAPRRPGKRADGSGGESTPSE